MAWITLTEDDLTSVLAGPEIEKIGQAALKLGQDDPIQASLDEVVDECRGYIASCDKNILGDGLTIPSRLKGKILDMAAHRVLTRVLLTPNKARQGRYESAEKLMERVADCKYAIEKPANAEDDPNEDPVKYPSPVIGETPPRQMRRQHLDGM